jgi:aminoglycoside phosphotransferase (APT) family kinase protein
MRLAQQVVGPLHEDELRIDTTLVRQLVARAMPEHADEPVTRLSSSGSTNALFRLGDDLLVRLPRQPGGSRTIAKEARWLPRMAPAVPSAVPEVVAVFGPDLGYPEHWSVVRWLDGDHPRVVTPETPLDPGRTSLALDLASLVRALGDADVPPAATEDPDLHGYRGEPLATMDEVTRTNLDRCGELVDFDADLDAARRVWDEAMRLPGVGDRGSPRWYHSDLAAENLLVRDSRLSAVLDFGGLAIGDPTVDLVVAWEVLDPPAREVFRRHVGVDDATWLRGRAWALSISLMIWYYWTTMPDRRASRVAVLRNVLADAVGGL